MAVKEERDCCEADVSVKEQRNCLGGRNGRVFRRATVWETEVSVKRGARRQK